ncbi:MAG: hypothetical protein L3K17_04155 [Thermoplasmata archaeon]|nr:hypothetical protein [Thermoplasmata archaeon]
MLERELAPAVVHHLEADGYRVWVDPDGSDFLDVVARRGPELGLVELKVADWRKVLAQAQRRRGWADWIAVALPRESLAARVCQAPQAPRGLRVGVWIVEGGAVRVLRAAQPLWAPGEARPFPELRDRIQDFTDRLIDGSLSPGVRWNLPGSSGRVGPNRRSTRDWRLEEFPVDE